MPHWTRRIAVEVRPHSTEHTESQQDKETEDEAEEEGEGEGEGGGEETDIKSNNPHLTGGEKCYWEVDTEL